MEKEIVCGIDEAGRGALAGPLAVAGVILQKPIEGLDDSKKLTPQKREKLYDMIIKNAKYEIVFTDNLTLDEIGLSLAIKNSILIIQKKLNAKTYIMDGNTNFGIENIKAIVKADSSVYQVSAASILAKVSRDRYMIEMDKEYPKYSFGRHKGYGTKVHVEKIKKYGLSPLHRKSFKVKSLRQPSLFD